jgi:ketosteroid isomerase-like protein
MEELADMQSLLQMKGAMITAWNEGVVNNVADFYSEDAVLFDDDGGQMVSGKNGK